MAFLGLAGAAGGAGGATAPGAAATGAAASSGLPEAAAAMSGVDSGIAADASASPGIGGLFSGLLKDMNGGQAPTLQSGLTNMLGQQQGGGFMKQGGMTGPSPQFATMVQQLMARAQQPPQTDWSWLLKS